jgi:hypothetical protein
MTDQMVDQVVDLVEVLVVVPLEDRKEEDLEEVDLWRRSVSTQ